MLYKTHECSLYRKYTVSVTNINQSIFRKKFQDIEKYPSKKLQYYAEIRDSLKFSLDVSVDCKIEISITKQKELAQKIQNRWSQSKARIREAHKPFFDQFEIDQNIPVIDTIYTWSNTSVDIPEDYKILLEDESNFIKKSIDVSEPETIIILNNITKIDVGKNKINQQEIEDFFDWQFNDTASDYFSVFQSIFWCIQNGQYLQPKDYEKLREKLFDYNFLLTRNYSGRKVLNDKNGDYSADNIALDYKIFWLTPDLEFELDSQNIAIKCKLGRIHLRIESFFNMFVGDHDYESTGYDESLEDWDDSTVDSLMELDTNIFSKNLKSLHDEFARYRTHNDSLVLSKSQMTNLYRFFYGEPKRGLAYDSFCTSRKPYDFFEFWKKYPDFVRYFVLALITVDHHVNGFLPSKHLFLYGDKILQEKNRNYYFENIKFIYNLLQRTGNKELSWNILIIFLNNTSKIAYQKNHWRQIADYIERDFPPKIKIIMNNFLRNIADLCPDNEQTQYIKRIIEPTNLDAVTDFDGRILNTRFEHDVIPFFEEEENETLEFKQTFSFNTRTGKQKCEDIRYAALKEIVGFLNTGSGCLVIGIHDKTKEIIGIEEDGFKGDRDKYSLQINDIVATSCGETAASLLSIQFHEVSGRTVCKVLCKKSEEPIYCKFKNHQESPFVRTGSSTRKPDYKEWDKFRRQHFPKNSV